MVNLKGSSSMQATPEKNLNPGLICLALAIVTIAAFWQIQDCGFINFDDDVYVYENAYIQSGLNWDSLKQAFSFDLASRSGHWHPLTWISWLIDYSIFGLDPLGYHLVNLLFHLLNTILLFWVLRRMTKTLWPSAFVAALFAIHPLHVESVAWITERKDVLSTFFMMLTIGAYSYYVEKRTFLRYFLLLLFFILGLMSKSMLVTLPFVLLLLDYWPLGRFSEGKLERKIQMEALKPVTLGKSKKKPKKKDDLREVPEVRKTLEVQKPVAPEFQWSRIYPLLLEKVPLFALSILASIAAYYAAQFGNAVDSIGAIPLVVRIGNAFVSYVTYIGKMILPVNLAVFYPHPVNVVLWQVLGAAILLIAITVAILWKVKRLPYLAMGWLWYLGMLVPVIGIVQAGSQALADRYTYIPLIGLFIIVAWGVPDLLKKVNYRKSILLTASVFCILCLSILTWKQVGYWQNNITLYNHTLETTENNWFIYNNRAVSYINLHKYRQAIEDCNRAIEIKSGFAEPYNNRCIAYNILGNNKQAIDDCSKAIAINSRYADAYFTRGNSYYDLGNYKQAIEDFGRAAELKQDYAVAFFNRGNAYYNLGNYNRAVEDYGRAIELKKRYMEAYFNRGIAYAKFGNKDLAVTDLVSAARLGDERAKTLLKRNGISW